MSRGRGGRARGRDRGRARGASRRSQAPSSAARSASDPTRRTTVMTVQTTTASRWRLPRPPGPERSRRRHRDHPRQGHRHRRLRPGLPGRHRAPDHRRPHRDRQRRHLPPLRRGDQPAGPATREGGKPLDEVIGDLQESGAAKKTSGAISGAKKALSRGSDDDEDEEPASGKKSSSRRRQTRRCRDGGADVDAETAGTSTRVRARRGRARRTPRRPGSTTRRVAVRARTGGLAAVVERHRRSTVRPGAGATCWRTAASLESLVAAHGTVVPVRVRVRPGRRARASSRTCWRPARSYFVELLDQARGPSAVQPAGAPTTRSRCWPRWSQANPQIAELRRRTRDLPEDALHPDRVRLGELVLAGARRTSGRRTPTDPAARTRIVPLAVRTSRPGAGVDRVCSTSPCCVERTRSEELEARARGPRGGRARTDPAAASTGPMAPYDFVGERDMGLITGLLGLPLAPLRGTVAVAEQIRKQAEDEFYDPAAIRGAARGGRPAARAGRC